MKKLNQRLLKLNSAYIPILEPVRDQIIYWIAEELPYLNKKLQPVGSLPVISPATKERTKRRTLTLPFLTWRLVQGCYWMMWWCTPAIRRSWTWWRRISGRTEGKAFRIIILTTKGIIFRLWRRRRWRGCWWGCRGRLRRFSRHYHRQYCSKSIIHTESYGTLESRFPIIIF